ncbi:MAG: O-antigen ligase family protein [Candidatus Omnitrophica bacterium]|nr:O-antigen ligase family protein [Candidatus Omnitrophota bacterium]
MMPGASMIRPSVFVSAFLGVMLGSLFLGLLPLAALHPFFLLAVPFLCVFFLVLVLKPAAVVALLVFSRALLDPLLNLTRGDNSLGFGAVLNLFVVLMTLSLALRSPALFFKPPFVKAWLVFLAVCAVSVVRSPAPVPALKVFFNLLSYWCMAMLPSLVDPKKDDEKFWVRLLVVSSLLPALFAGLRLVQGGGRISGTFTHPNILAFYLVWAIAAVFYILRSESFRPTGPGRTLLAVYVPGLLALLLATGSRNAWVGCWLFFFVYGLLRERKYVFISLAALLSVFLVSDVASRVTDLFAYQAHRLNSFEWRLEVWKDSLAPVREKLFLGHGLGSFRELSADFLFSERQGAEAHNAYLQLLFETGLAGLLAYLAVYKAVAGLVRAERRGGGLFGISRRQAVILSYLVFYLVSSFADNLLYYLAFNWCHWFFLGVMLKPALSGPSGRLRRAAGPP